MDPLTPSRRTRAAIPCFEAELNREPVVMPAVVYDSIGATKRERFRIPTVEETPKEVLRDLILLQPALAREKRALEAMERRQRELAEGLPSDVHALTYAGSSSLATQYESPSTANQAGDETDPEAVEETDPNL